MSRDDDVAGVDAAGEVGERAPGVEVGPQLRRRLHHGAPAEQRGARARGLAAAQLEGRVHLRHEDRRRQPGHLDGELDQHGEQPLAHLGVAVVERDRAVAPRPRAAPSPTPRRRCRCRCS